VVLGAGGLVVLGAGGGVVVPDDCSSVAVR
jgi:hypothetical protein